MNALRRLKQQNNSAVAPTSTTFGAPPSRIPEVGAPVVIVIVELTELFVPGDVDTSDHVDGRNSQLALAGNPEQLSVIVVGAMYP